MSGVRIVSWTPRESGARRGFCTATFPSGATVHDCTIFEQNGRWWASPPSRPMLGRDGLQSKDESGKLRWAPVLTFTDKDRRNLWSDGIIKALHAQHPEVVG
jgi:hypothetical protein